MPRPILTPQLDIPVFNTIEFWDRNYDSASPYPPSSPSVDNSDDDTPYSLSNTGLRSSIATLPEAKLRAIMVKLADSNPSFQRAITKELTYMQSYDLSSPTTPTNDRRRKAHRSKTRRNLKNLSVSTQLAHAHIQNATPLQVPCKTVESTYHPGNLEEEVYEFLSRAPDDVAHQVVRTITMWSCCDEDEWSPGCMAAPVYSLPILGDEEKLTDIMEFTHSDVFPDSDLEQPSHDFFYRSITRPRQEE